MNKLAKAMIAYYIALSLVFFGGRMYVLESYQMKKGPVPMEAFHQLYVWVYAFSYLYVIPLLAVGLWLIIRRLAQLSISPLLRIVLALLFIGLAVVVGYFLLFLFLLLFYGFAP